jgi:hypothetical protein
MESTHEKHVQRCNALVSMDAIGQPLGWVETDIRAHIWQSLVNNVLTKPARQNVHRIVPRFYS